jgi:hypothetical protein
MLKDIGCTWVIIGHSERREGFGMAGEPEELCAQKCKVAVDKGLKVMFVSFCDMDYCLVFFLFRETRKRLIAIRTCVLLFLTGRWRKEGRT